MKAEDMKGVGVQERIEGGATFLGATFGVVGVLAIAGGIALCVQLWPGEPIRGLEWTPAAYIPSLTWLATGLISGIYSFAIAAVITYLVDIRDHLRRIRGVLASQSWADRQNLHGREGERADQ